MVMGLLGSVVINGIDINGIFMESIRDKVGDIGDITRIKTYGFV